MTFIQMLEAARTGKRIRKGSVGAYVSADSMSFSYADTQYSGWEIEVEVPRSLTLGAVKNAWDSVRPTGGSVATASESAFFKRFAQSLGFTLVD